MDMKKWLDEHPGWRPPEPVPTQQQTDAKEKAEKQRQMSLSVPFDRRSEVSADARYIVRWLVVWFLVIPVCVGLLLYFLR